MKKSILLLTSLVCFALSSASLPAALSYWDGNGTDPGAGPAPTGTWGTDTSITSIDSMFWTYDPLGVSQTNDWVNGDTAVFSAGTDATNAFTVNVDPNFPPSIGGLIFEEGLVDLEGGTLTMTNDLLCPIVCYTNAIINSALADLAGTCGFVKTGPGTLTLGGNSTYGGTNLVAEGVVSVTAGGASTFPLGSSSTPTIVSNGATLRFDTSAAQYEPVILYGNGSTNQGALRGTGGSSAWNGGASLMSNARINYDGGGTWTWQGSGASGSGPGVSVCTTNSGTFYDVTIGGNGGTIRMNINGRWATTGNGKIIKDGLCRLQLETPAYATNGFYFNGGEIFPRYPGYGSGPIYVAAAPYVCFMALPNTSPTIGLSIVLAPGANLLFDARQNSSTHNQLSFTVSGVISGSGGLSVTNFGKTIFSGANTYTGPTTILAGAFPGTLILSGNGSIANSPVIDVQSGGTFDVSAVTATPYVIGAAQTLKGNGTVVGNVTANGTLSPGDSIGTLTFNGNLTLGASAILQIEVDRSASPSSDLIAVTGTLSNTGGGAVQMVNTGAALQVNDSFQVFNQLVPNGQALTVVGGGVVWNNTLATDGTVKVASTTATPATIQSITKISPTSFTITALGAANTPYGVFVTSTVTTPMANWTMIGATTADGGGVMQFTDTAAPGTQRYYRFGQ